MFVKLAKTMRTHIYLARILTIVLVGLSRLSTLTTDILGWGRKKIYKVLHLVKKDLVASVKNSQICGTKIRVAADFTN